MARREPYPGPEGALAQYLAAISTVPGIERKGAANPYTSRNGHMFSFLDREGAMALRLPDDARADYLAAHESGPVTSYGTTMREYVQVPRELMATPAAIEPWIRRSWDWIGSLTPKPTRRTSTTTSNAISNTTSTVEGT